MKKMSFLFLFLSLLLAACAPKVEVSQNGIEIAQSKARLSSAGMAGMNGMGAGESTPGAVFMTIKNANSETDTLVGVSADFGDAELHETVMVDNVMSMRPVPQLEIPAGAMVELKSGSYHIMIMNPKAVHVGDIVHITLQFEKAGEVIVPISISNK